MHGKTQGIQYWQLISAWGGEGVGTSLGRGGDGWGGEGMGWGLGSGFYIENWLFYMGWGEVGGGGGGVGKGEGSKPKNCSPIPRGN